MERKVGTRRTVKVKEKIGFPNGLIIPSEGRSGGMALLWIKDVDVEIKRFSITYRHDYYGSYLNIQVEDDRVLWKPRNKLEERIMEFASISQFPVPNVVGMLGDFNEILSATEKARGPERSQQQMESFREALNICGFQDMGYEGPDFTQCNQKHGREESN